MKRRAVVVPERVSWWFAVVALASGCSGGEQVRKSHGPAVPLDPVVVLGAAEGAGAVAGTKEELLKAARAGPGEAAGGLERITGFRWREKTFDRTALDEALAVGAAACYPDADPGRVASKLAFAERHGVGFEEFSRAWLAGYAELFERRYGVLVSNVYLVKAGESPGHAMTLSMKGSLPDPSGSIGYGVRWQEGRFALSRGSPGAARRKTVSPAQPPGDRTLVTVVLSRRGDYYAYPDHKWAKLRLPATGEEQASKKLFVGRIKRAFAEPAEYVTATGERFEGVVTAARWTDTFILRPGAANPFGLKNDVHLVEATLDGSALPGSILVTKSLAVLDNTTAYPLDMSRVYHEALRRSHRAWRGAQAALKPAIQEIVAGFDEKTKSWSKGKTKPKGRLETSKRDHTKQTPRFSWDAEGGTMTITLRFSRRVTRIARIWYPNPVLKNFHCPEGVPCATPPPEVSDDLEHGYTIGFVAGYTFDRNGKLIEEKPGKPTVAVQQGP